MSGPRYVKVPNDFPGAMLNDVRPDVAMLNVAAWAEASQWVNDGRFARAEARRLPAWTQYREDQLVAAGYWCRLPDGGIELVGYLDVNASREAIGRARAAMSEGGRTGGRRASETHARDPRTKQFVRDEPEVRPEVPLAPLPLPVALPQELPSLPTSLPDGWEGFGKEWTAFAEAWRRRFRLPPSGSEDAPRTQRATLWEVVRDYPAKAAAWCGGAPAGASSYDVVAHVRREWLRERERGVA